MTTTEADREAFEVKAKDWGLEIVKTATKHPYYRSARTSLAWFYWTAALAYARRNGQENIGG